MSQVSGTVDTLDIVGAAEDVEDVIFTISPTETPALTMAKKKKATATLHQWQTDALTAAALNAQIEGDDASFTTATPTVLLSNYTQISRKTLIVSETADVVRKYGRAKETARLIVKYGKELKRDIEAGIVGRQGSSAGGSSTARQSAGMGAMITNYRLASGTGSNTTGTVPGYAAGVWTAPTDGTASTFVEADLKAALEASWTDGGNVTTIMTNSVNKQKIAGFAGATAYAGFYNPTQGRAQGAVIAGVDTYVSDFGSHKVVLNRYMASTVVYCLDPEYVSYAWLRNIKMTELAKTGDAEKSMLIGEGCLVLDNPDAHAQIRATNTA